jgi:cytoskeletal protein RodZ
MDGDTARDPTLFPTRVGEKLRAAREAQKLDLAEIASRTRIPQRHLEAIEQSNFSGLPSVTYALGFAKAYARAVGADEVALARELRRELGDRPERPVPIPTYELGDSARVPPRGLAWAGAIVAIVLLLGVGLWYGTGLFRGSAPPPDSLVPADSGAAAAPANAPAPAPAAAPAAGGEVTLIARDTVWLRVTDASGKRLFEKEMAAGDRYDVPADADRPRVRTGRPDRVQVQVNGSNVAPLGAGVETIEVEVSPAALAARASTGGAAQPAASATPSAAPGQVPAGNAAGVP